ncbi:uncharacterized protein B0T23DRAFT_379772 [Neurospora hispaniola]|uniref:Uncharacterized protein n=1 Tax=Neurospora hispaniola TaxID=588809 RepID=A0AAJ0I7T6_9PEZI|nr:hypothetical protein B0T23DRAFT_379772 [Neurospora hispaniola]
MTPSGVAMGVDSRMLGCVAGPRPTKPNAQKLQGPNGPSRSLVGLAAPRCPGEVPCRGSSSGGRLSVAACVGRWMGGIPLPMNGCSLNQGPNGPNRWNPGLRVWYGTECFKCPVL